MAYVPFDYDDAPYLGSMPLRKSGRVTCDVSQYVPAGAKEILVYLFLTCKTADRRKNRAVYQIYTEDDQGKKYSQLMNAAFPRDDYVMNSANLWLPLLGSERKFTVYIPDSFGSESGEIGGTEKQHSYKYLKEAMNEYVTSGEEIFSGIFLLGYRT